MLTVKPLDESISALSWRGRSGCVSNELIHLDVLRVVFGLELVTAGLCDDVIEVGNRTHFFRGHLEVVEDKGDMLRYGEVVPGKVATYYRDGKKIHSF